MKIKQNIPYFIGFALIIIVFFWAMSGIEKECRAKGGIPVGYHGLDCWDNINKTFIK